MKIFEFIPKKNTNKLTMITAFLLMGAAVIFLVTMLCENMPYRWMLQLLSIGMLGVMIFIVTRYIMKNFVYTVQRTEEGDDFTVTELQGRRSVTVCRIGMSSVEQVTVVERNDRHADMMLKNTVKAQKRKMFDYCADLISDKYICVLANECGTALAIKLSYDESLEALFGIDGTDEDKKEE